MLFLCVFAGCFWLVLREQALQDQQQLLLVQLSQLLRQRVEHAQALRFEQVAVQVDRALVEGGVGAVRHQRFDEVLETGLRNLLGNSWRLVSQVRGQGLNQLVFLEVTSRNSSVQHPT